MTALLLASPLAADVDGTAVRSAVAGVSPAVVRIRLIGDSGSGDLSVSSRVTTGLAISDDGFVLTSAFGMTGHAAGIFIEDSNGDRTAAKIVATDHVRKLVLLKCAEGKFVTAEYSKERWPAVGTTVVAVGRMFPGASPAVSVGIVSAVKRIFGLAIQTDAKISPVNYGGPLINRHGHVLGLLVPLSPSDAAEAIEAGVEWYDSGIGFAIPIQDALEAADVLRKGTDRSRGTMGVRLSTRNPLATEFDVALVHPDSPASKAGLQKGDVIVQANGVAIDRFGNLESIVKRAYVGDRMSLVIRRGDEEIRTELVLAEPLSRPPRGFLGMIVGAEVKADDDNVLGIRVTCLPESVLTEAGVPETAVLTAWNGTTLTSRTDLRKALAAAMAGQPVELTWLASAEKPEPVATTVTPVERTQTLLPLSPPMTAQIVGSTEGLTWQRGESKLDDDGGHVWFYAPETAGDREFGMVVLLSEAGTAEEVVLKRWRAICESQNLLLAVPITPEKTGLTREHRSMILKAVAAVAKDRTVTSGRSFLVAGAEQADVCTELILQLRGRQFGAAVFTDAWPQVSGVSQALLSVASPAVLILNASIQSRQRQALLQQAVSTLRKAEAWVIQHSEQDDNITAEQLISDWALNLSIR